MLILFIVFIRITVVGMLESQNFIALWTHDFESLILKTVLAYLLGLRLELLQQQLLAGTQQHQSKRTKYTFTCIRQPFWTSCQMPWKGGKHAVIVCVSHVCVRVCVCLCCCHLVVSEPSAKCHRLMGMFRQNGSEALCGFSREAGKFGTGY